MSGAIPIRTMTLGGQARYNGIRIYTKNANGDCREACNNTWTDEISDGLARGARNVVDTGDNWTPGEFQLTADRASTLCSFGWREWHIAVFYQTTDEEIRCHKHDNIGWSDGGFSQPDAHKGTDMDEVHSSDAGSIMLFYQDTDGYLCYQKANGWSWGPKRRLTKACRGTGVTVTDCRDDLREIRVFYQDEQYNVCHYRGSYYDDNSWSYVGSVTSAVRPLGTMSVVSWVDSGTAHMRLYLQNADDDLVEWCSPNGLSWSLGGFRHPALPGSDVLAYTRTLTSKASNGTRTNLSTPLIGVLWAGSDQILHQRIFAPGMSWLDETPIAYLLKAGTLAGAWNGTRFRDSDSGAAYKKIKKIVCRSGWYLDGIQVHFTDGSSTPWRGGNGGNLREFALLEGEDISQVVVTHNNSQVLKIQFITSKGRKSDTYGTTGGSSDVWDCDGLALAGFAGAAGTYVNGLMPLWSYRPTGVGPTALKELIQEMETMKKDIDDRKNQCNQLKEATEALQRELNSQLQPLANSALQGIETLGNSIVALHRAPDKSTEATSNQVATCKGQSKIVAERFNALHTKATGILQRAGDNSIEATRQVTTADNQMKRIDEMGQITAAMKVNADVVKQLRQDRVNESSKSIENAQAVKREAEKKKASSKTARIIRDIFTLGLGELGDWGGINAQIDYANKLIQSCENDLQTCRTALREAEQAISKIDREIAQYSQLQTSLNAYLPRLRELKQQADDLRQRNQETSNKSLDVSGFLSVLAAKGEALQLGLSAQDFAQRVLDVQTALNGKRPQGLMWDQPAQLQSTLEMIATSSIPALDLGDLM